MLMRMALVAGLLVVLCMGAPARELSSDLRPLFDGFQAHRRIALGYLRTENTDLAAVEIERLRDRWTADRRRLAPDIAADQALASAIARTEAGVTASLAAADRGDVVTARRLLHDAAEPLDDWRKANAIRLFSDCIAEVGAAYERLDRFRRDAPDLADRALGEEIVGLASEAGAALARCDREAAPAVRGEPEFRRLVDGMRDSLRQVPEAVSARDRARLHRLLIEQRSFERLLAFRFG
jgi:hypothetical protein